jgi:hypothetical protein
VLREGKASEIEQWETPRFHLTSSAKRIVVGVDGEREEYDTPVTVRILPKALHVYVPPEGERNRPMPVLSWKLASQTWHEVHPKRQRDVI